MLCSLDECVADIDGGFGWAMPDAEVHAHVNAAEREIGCYLYGRRTYEVMTYWETGDPTEQNPVGEYAGIWQAADKVIYSRTLPEVRTARTRLVREFDPTTARERVSSSERAVSIGGAELAGQALERPGRPGRRLPVPRTRRLGHARSSQGCTPRCAWSTNTSSAPAWST